jgi:hypothetical protein
MKSPWRKRAKLSLNQQVFGKPAQESKKVYVMILLAILVLGLLV